MQCDVHARHELYVHVEVVVVRGHRAALRHLVQAVASEYGRLEGLEALAHFRPAARINYTCIRACTPRPHATRRAHE